MPFKTDPTPQNLASVLERMLTDAEVISENGSEGYIESVAAQHRDQHHASADDPPAQLVVTFSTGSAIKITLTPVMPPGEGRLYTVY